MKKKLVVALMAMMVAGTTLATSNTAEAAGLTQAGDPSMVEYSSMPPEAIPIIESMFDFEYYKAQNPELVEALGDDYQTLFEHFYKCGIYEGRACNPNFDPAAYASAYTDLDFSDKPNPILNYYMHYALIGSKEGRDITTLEACANAGITVTALFDESVKITPDAYIIANILGIYNYADVQRSLTTTLVAAAKNKGAAIASSNSDAVVVITPKGDSEAMELCKGLTKVREIQADGCHYYLWVDYTGDAYNVRYTYWDRNGENISSGTELEIGNYNSEDQLGYVKVYLLYGVDENGEGVLGATDAGVAFNDVVEQLRKNSSYFDPEVVRTVYMYDEIISSEDGNYNICIDSEGTSETPYTISVGIIDSDENGFILATGIYNENNQYALYREHRIDYYSTQNNNEDGSVNTSVEATTSTDNTTSNSTNTETTSTTEAASEGTSEVTDNTTSAENTSSTEGTDNTSSNEGTDNTNNE